jgi:hypothetical protein
MGLNGRTSPQDAPPLRRSARARHSYDRIMERPPGSEPHLFRPTLDSQPIRSEAPPLSRGA